MIDTQHSIHIQLNNEQKWATVVGHREEGKTIQAIQRTSPTLVRMSQLTEPNRIYDTEEKRQGRRKIGWAQAIYPLRARLQELKNNALLDKWDEALEDELMRLKKGELAILATRPKLIQAGYTSLDSIPRIQKGSGTRFYGPVLKGWTAEPKKE